VAVTEHERIRELLALAAGDALAADEIRRVEQHTAACAECAQEMEVWRSLAQKLRRLPTPQPRPETVERARAIAEARLRQAAEDRGYLRMMIFLVVFAWVLMLASWPVYRVLAGGMLEWYGPSFIRNWMGFAVWTSLGWLIAGIAAAVLAAQQRRERRLA
jgi:anti-sigma factor RsiW